MNFNNKNIIYLGKIIEEECIIQSKHLSHLKSIFDRSNLSCKEDIKLLYLPYHIGIKLYLEDIYPFYVKL